MVSSCNLDNSLEIETTAGAAFNPLKKQKRYTIIRVVDEKLERLAAGVLQNQSDKLGLLEKIEEMNLKDEYQIKFLKHHVEEEKNNGKKLTKESAMAKYYASEVAVAVANDAVQIFGGYGLMLPQINYETFGAGFSRLPSELGGSRQGAEGSRMSGRGME